MLTRAFDVRPAPREALQLTLALWVTVMIFVAILSVWSEQVTNLAEGLSLFTGMTTALGFAGALYLAFRLVIGQPVWLAIIGIVTATAFCTLGQTAADYAGQYALNAIFPVYSPPPLASHLVARTLLYYACLYGLNASLFWITFANRRAREHATELADARSQAARAEVAALRLQLNPHFMFNSLSAISGLIAAGRHTEAQATVDKLADFLRTSLTPSAAGKVSLQDEMTAVDAYLQIESVRFADRLTVDMDVPLRLSDALVPDLMLQPLVENAVKYAVAPSSQPVRLSIAAQTESGQLLLAVEDDGAAGPVATAKGLGIGLNNTADRLQSLYGADASLSAVPTARGYRVEIRLPLEFAA